MQVKTILISGGTDGIGQGAVEQLLSEGHKVATFSRSQEKCDDLERELAGEYSADDYLVMTGDVVDEASLQKVIAAANKKFGDIDILINNAGFGYFVECDQVDIKRYEEMVQTNVIGLTRLTKLVVPQMKKRGSGLVLNIVSIAGKRSSARSEFYCSTKFAVMGYSEGLRDELKEFGIRVATICPGMIDTSFFTKEELEHRKQGAWGGRTPKMLSAEDINRVVSLICNQSEVSDIWDITVMPFDKGE